MTKSLSAIVGLAVVASLVSVSYGQISETSAGISRVQNQAQVMNTAEGYFSGLSDPLTVSTDKDFYLPGEPVNITATFHASFLLTFPSSMTMYYVIMDSDGRVLYDMSKHYYWLAVITHLAVYDGYSRSFIWNQLDDDKTPVGSPKWLQVMVIVPAWEITLVAEDKFEINPMPAAFQAALVPGWNLVSFPLLNDTWHVGGMGLESGTTVAEWDALAQSYREVYIVGVTPASRDFSLTPGTSYFVWSEHYQTLGLSGCSPEVSSQYTESLSVPSDGGWSCVGFNTLGPGPNASDIDAMVKHAKVTVVCKWDPVSETYIVYLPGITPPSHDFVIGPGDGCWLRTDGPCTMTYSP